MTDSLHAFLSDVEKPLRYLNNELNASHRDFHSADVRFCLIYPDVYEVGISHLGLKILYSIINNTTDAMADRAYTPWTDLAEKLISHNIPLTAIESKVPLTRFDCLGFTLQTELTYTNILYTLQLAQIPIQRVHRMEHHPIIMAGGINAINPHPLSKFIDAFFIGEAEEGIVEVIEIFTTIKAKAERLKALSKLSYIYVPDYSEKGKVIHAKKYFAFSDSVQTHFPQLVPLLEGTHNRYTAEIMRGCTRGCRFCQAGMFYRPTREKNPDIITHQLIADISKSGWDSAGLLALSSNDYSHIKPLLTTLTQLLHGSGVSLSLPSLRVDTLDSSLLELINALKKSGVTLAPEAGTQRLRDIINKNLTEQDILCAVKYAFEASAKLIKLYFMIGLPCETPDDIDGIIALVEKIVSATHRKMRINISISPFVPKPMTPFQWSTMEDEADVLSKARRIKSALSRYKMIKISYHTIELSYLEALLSRGDADVAQVIEQAFLDGAKFDGWKEHFDYAIWREAAKKVGYGWDKIIKGFDTQDSLPWDNISLGVKKEFLLAEYDKALKLEKTVDCRADICTHCGVCENPLYADISAPSQSPILPSITTLLNVSRPSELSIQPTPHHYRIYYAKTNDLRYISHLDFLRLIHRILMISGLPIAFSKGFNPHPRTSFCPPLSTGISGTHEFFDIIMTCQCQPSDIVRDLSKTKIADLTFHCALPHTQCMPPISDYQIETMLIHPSPQQCAGAVDVVKLCGNDATIKRHRKGKEKIVDINDIILEIKCENGSLIIKKTIQGATVFDIVEKLFGIHREQTAHLSITRTGLYTCRTR
jgi:radical SAM family uncharacterized protein/radical SAM-linked protein